MRYSANNPVTESFPMSPRDKRVSVAPDVLMRELEGEAVLLNLESGVYYTLNPVGTAIWEQLTGEQTLTEILSAICTRYGVSAETARRDLAALATRLRREGLIEERR